MGKSLALVAILLLPSCSLMADLKDAGARVNEIADEAKVVIVEARQIVADADIDKSGKLDTPAELWAALAGLVALGGKVLNDSKKRSTGLKTLFEKQAATDVAMASIKAKTPGM